MSTRPPTNKLLSDVSNFNAFIEFQSEFIIHKCTHVHLYRCQSVREQLAVRLGLFVVVQPQIIIIFIEQSMLVGAISRHRLMSALRRTEFSHTHASNFRISWHPITSSTASYFAYFRFISSNERG